MQFYKCSLFPTHKFNGKTFEYFPTVPSVLFLHDMYYELNVDIFKHVREHEPYQFYIVSATKASGRSDYHEPE
jgi:hypothetical protein